MYLSMAVICLLDNEKQNCELILYSTESLDSKLQVKIYEFTIGNLFMDLVILPLL